MPFQERDARLFYGRDELADRLVRRLGERLAGRLGGAGIVLVAGLASADGDATVRPGIG